MRGKFVGIPQGQAAPSFRPFWHSRVMTVNSKHLPADITFFVGDEGEAVSSHRD
jgi:hypothetical protein